MSAFAGSIGGAARNPLSPATLMTTAVPYALRVQVVAYTAEPGVPNAIAHTTMNYRIDLIGQTSYVRTKPIFSHTSIIFCIGLTSPITHNKESQTHLRQHTALVVCETELRPHTNATAAAPSPPSKPPQAHHTSSTAAAQQQHSSRQQQRRW